MAHSNYKPLLTAAEASQISEPYNYALHDAKGEAREYISRMWTPAAMREDFTTTINERFPGREVENMTELYNGTDVFVVWDGPSNIVAVLNQLEKRAKFAALADELEDEEQKAVPACQAWPMPNADDCACNTELAKQYVEQREEDARKFTKSLEWKNDDGIRFRNCIYADVYGVRIIHDLSGDSVLGCGNPWGELFKHETKEDGSVEVVENIRFNTFYNFVAYMLKKHW